MKNPILLIFSFTAFILTACGSPNQTADQAMVDQSFLYRRTNDCDHRVYSKHFLSINGITAENTDDHRITQATVEFYFEESPKQVVDVVVKTTRYGTEWTNQKQFSWRRQKNQIVILKFDMNEATIENQKIKSADWQKAKPTKEIVPMNENEYQLSCVANAFIQN
jgi:hypothetical protein